MSILLNSLLLIILFIILGVSADYVVRNIKYLGTHLKIRLFVFGILLGIITTLPELSLGINAVINDVPGLSVGNLLGGVLVMLGLILGCSLILNREVETDGKFKTLLPSIAFLLFPFLLGLDGNFDLTDGLIFIFSYIILIYFLYRFNEVKRFPLLEIINTKKIGQAVLIALLGIIGILLASHWIVEITLDILNSVNINPLVIGLIIFSIGTNLPEISITITSWRKKSSELSLSHLIGSALSNMLVLGILSFIKPMNFNLDITYWVTAIFSIILLTFFAYFYLNDKKMDRLEGIILVLIYIGFIFANIYFINQPI